MIILGIDPGTGRTGWGVILSKPLEKIKPKITYVAHGCIVTTQVDVMERRLHILHDNINALILLHKPECLIIEHIFFGRNVKTAISVSQARGVIMLSASLHGLPIFEYTPSTVKLSLVGSGKAEKKEVQQTVRRILNSNSRTLAFNGKKDKDFDDSADALAIAIHHVFKLANPTETTAKPVKKKVKVKKAQETKIKKKK
jgi:crossover junction endodeoxyribonuclease RuvC